MDKPSLTVDVLIERGFEEIGCWELNDARDLIHRIELPTTSGDYAFAINGRVHYVGLASKSLRQRLGFYRKPGKSQRTNIRLNEVIRGHLAKGTVVQILIAHPPDTEWNGFKLKGAEGLEAGLIEDFILPWNMRGTAKAPRTKPSADVPRQSNVRDRIFEQIRKRPGMTELELAKTIYGPGALQPQANPHCRRLVAEGLVERRGGGGVNEPFVYYPVK